MGIGTTAKDPAGIPGARAAGVMADRQPGDHLCCLYATEAEHRAVLTGYLRQGLERGEKVLYIVDAHTAEAILDYLRDDGLNVEPYRARGQLAILGYDDTYLRTGAFDPDGMVALLRSETERAIAEGYAALRVSGEMTWALRGLPGTDRLIEYEARLNEFFPGSRCLALCQYDRRHFAPDVLLDVLRTHPRVVIGAELCDNPYFIPPADLLRTDRAATDLDRWVGHLTERKHAEEALRASEVAYRGVFEQAPVGIFRSTPEGKFIAVNPELARMFKYDSPADLMEHVNRTSIAEALYVDVAKRGRLVAQATEDGSHWVQTENHYRCKDGTIVIANLYFRRVTGAPGEPPQLEGFVQDVTQEQQATTETAAQRQFYESILENVHEGVWVADRSDNITYVNHGMLRIAGVSHTGVVGINVLTGFPEATLREFRPFYLCARETLQPTPYEVFVVTPAGRPTWQSGWLVPRVRDGRFDGMICTILDVTERKQAEDRLRDSEALLHAAEHLARVGGWRWDVPAQQMYWTDELYRLHGFTPGEIKPGSPEHIARSLQCYDPDDRTAILSAFERCATHGDSYDLLARFTTAVGQRLWVRTAAQSVWKNGKVVTVVGNLQDVTAQKQTEEALVRQADLLAAIRRAQGLFILRQDPARVFRDLLHILVTATQSEFGFLDEVHYDGDGTPYKVSLALSDIAWDEGSRRLYEQLVARNLEFRNLKNLSGAPVLEQQIIVANDPQHDPRSGGLPPGHPPLRSYMGIPLYVGREMVGVAGIANRPGGYTPEMAGFIEPLTSTTASIIWALRTAEREQATQAQLQHSEARLRAILDNIPDSAWLKDCAGRFIAVNQAFAARVGYTDPADLRGKTDYDVWPTVAADGFRRDDDIVMQDGRELRIEETVIVGDEPRTFETIKRPLRRAPAEVIGTVGIARDVTERKRVEEALRVSEGRHRALLDAEPYGVHEVDATGRIVYVNDASQRIHGYTRDELLGMPFWELLPPGPEREQTASHYAALLMEQPGPTPYVNVNQRKDGSLIDVQVNWDYLRNAGGNVTGRISVVTDVTRQRHSERVSALTSEILNAANRIIDTKDLLAEVCAIIQHHANCEAVGIRLLDETGNIPYEGYVGFPRPFYETESPLSIQRDECMCIAVIRGTTDPAQPFFTPAGSFYMNGTTRFLATVSEADKGSTRNVCNRMGYESVALIPIQRGETIIGLIHLADTRENRVPLSLVRVMEEVASRLGAAIQRTQAEARDRRSLAEKEVLLREVHHRVKNNLASIIGLLELQLATLDDEIVAGLMREVGGRIKAMSIVHELLYRSETLSEIDLHDYVDALIAGLPAATNRHTKIQIRTEVPSITMSLDTAIPCGLIINELVTNALKYAFPDERPGAGADVCRVTVRAAWDGTTYTLEVADNGVGLPAELDWANTRTLGLRLVRMLGQHQLQGQIELDRSSGTTFRLRFAPLHERRR